MAFIIKQRRLRPFRLLSFPPSSSRRCCRSVGLLFLCSGLLPPVRHYKVRAGDSARRLGARGGIGHGIPGATVSTNAALPCSLSLSLSLSGWSCLLYTRHREGEWKRKWDGGGGGSGGGTEGDKGRPLAAAGEGRLPNPPTSPLPEPAAFPPLSLSLLSEL